MRLVLMMSFALSCATATTTPIDASTVDVAAEPYAPPAVLWLDATLGVTAPNGLVNRWADRSGHANDAIQSDASSRPTFVPATSTARAGVRFTGGTYLVVDDGASLRFGTGDFYIAVVLAYTGIPSQDQTDGYQLVYSKQLTTDPYAGVGIFANSVIPSPSSAIGGQVDNATSARTATTGLNDGTTHLFAFHRRASTKTLTARLDGLAQATTSTARVVVNVDAPSRPVFIGAQPQAGQTIQHLDGTIYELIALAGTVSDDDIAGVESYLSAKYALH
jgi:hypothetical protein